ncbi:hypothetical protein MTCT_0983 [Methanothermobacter sp. CaT2]|uniref:hypothetical protein n=1 Tax=Methanothermobacter TaxID=145260 RepID=UPI0002CCF1E2|nr:hypothetical protein [Methanothermobacter sp. CaT2]BAM70231.1 hypothetical protein MTCT_0983 [Methanothermobacter sp. CaT2]
MITISFGKRDFLYDNGLVNIFFDLRRDERFENIDDYTVKYGDSKFELSDNKITFHGSFTELKETYFILRSIYYSKAFEETNNNRPYYDPVKDRVIIAPKLNVKPYLQRSERTKDLLPRMQVTEKKLEALKKEEAEAKNSFDGKVSGDLQYGKKGSNVMIYLEPKKLGESISSKIKKIQAGDKCFFCGSKYSKYIDDKNKKGSFSIKSTNLIFDFGTGDPKPSFRDLRLKKDITACFMCDLIYRYGLLNNYFVDNNVFIISAPSLTFLYNIKKMLIIPEDYLEESSRKTNFLKKGDFVTSGPYSRLLLLIQKIKRKIIDRDELAYLSIDYFVVTSRGVDDLKIYNKFSYISEFFDRIKNLRNKSGTPFLNLLMNYSYYKNISKPQIKNLPREEISRRILLGLPIDPVITDLSFYNLSQDNPSGINPLLIYKFLTEYLEVTGMSDMKELHNKCQLVGDRIGYFAAQYDKKDILYSIREIGNFERLTEFFKNLEYEILKEDAGAVWNSQAGDKKYSDLIQEILMDAKENRVALIRNYLAIYAIQKYLSAKYAKNKGGN